MKLKNLSRLLLFAFAMVVLASSCVKEGPMGLTGPAGADGKDGKDGKDANETCKMCHAATKVDLITSQFSYSKHKRGENYDSYSGNLGCSPCHVGEAFKYMVKNNVPSTFTLNTSTNKWSLDYAMPATAINSTYGDLGCSTCHSSIHTTYGYSDISALTTVAPVPLVMWGGKKVVDLKAKGGKSNLCVKCHQPRPQTHLQTGNAQDWVAIAANPTVLAYDANNNSATTNIVRPSYRMHIHYGSAGAIYAGMGGVEFAGPESYKNSAHTNVASCTDCHMGAMVGKTGGHTFTAKGNLTTCNATGCHSSAVTTSTTTLWVNPRAEIKTLLNNLAAKLTVNGVDILNRNGDSEHNLWYGLTTNNYDGYLNVYLPETNPDFAKYNPSTFQNPSPSSSWTAEQKAYNLTLPKLSLTNAQYGAIINFQLVLRDFSLGIHNFAYSKALLTNSIAIIK